MDLVHCDLSREWRGGQQQLLLLARELRRRGWRQTIVTRGAPAERWRREGFATIAPGWRALAALRGAAVAHAHDGRALGWVLLAAAGARRPARVATRRVAFALGRWGAAKYRRADRVVAVSEFIRAQLLARGLHPERVEVVPDCLDRAELPDASAARATVRAALGVAAAARCLGCASAFSPEKGVADLIAALPALEGDILVLLGATGPEASILRRQAERLGVARRLIWAGSGEQLKGASFSIPELIAACDVFVLPSRQEGLGSSLLLAMALGRPVVATATGGIPEIVSDGESGLLTPPGDVAALARTLARLLRDPELQRRLAANGARAVGERFSPAVVAAESEEIYRQALAARRQ